MNANRGTSRRGARPLAHLGRFFVLVALMYAVLMGCGGKPRPADREPVPHIPPESGEPMPDTTGFASMDPAVLGSQVYRERCVLCHGPEGKGDGPAAANMSLKPDLTNGKRIKSRTDEQLLNIIRNGKGGMPAWIGILSETEIQAVLKHVRSLAK